MKVLPVIFFVVSFPLICKGLDNTRLLFDNVKNCNVFDTPIGMNKCNRIRITAATIDMDGRLSFEGLRRKEIES